MSLEPVPKRSFIESLRPWLILIGILILYLAFATRTYYWDGVLFSLNIEGVHQGKLTPAVLFHPNHLLYSAAGYLLYSAAFALGLHARALTVLQILNALLSVSAGYVLYLLSKRLTNSSLIAIFSWLLFAVGATWWKFSTDADSYIVSVLLLILAAWFLLHSPQRIMAAAACHAAAMLFHELAIFTYVPVIAVIALDSQPAKSKKFWGCVAYVTGTGLPVAIAYLLCYANADHAAFPSFLRWVTNYASDSGFTHSAGQLAGAYLTSYIKLFLGGKLGFLRDYLSVPVCLSLGICCSALTCAIVLFRRPRPASVPTGPRTGIFFLWTWLLTYAVFLAIWDPGSAFHKLFVWPPIVLLIAVYASRRAALRERARGFLVLALAIGAWNFGAFIYPHSRASADPVLVLAQTIDKELPKGATIYYRALSPDDWYLEYFAPGRFWSPIQVQGGQVYMAFTNSPPGPVCLETTALELFADVPAVATQIDPARRWDLVNNKHNVRLECLKRPPGIRVYRR